MMGEDRENNFYKIRMSISGVNKGKSSGARVISYVIFLDRETVLLTEITRKASIPLEDMDVLINPYRQELIVNLDHPYFAQIKLK